MQTAWDQLRPGSILLELISLINSSFPFAPSEAAKKTSARVQKPCLNPQEEDAGQAAVSLGPADLGADHHLGGDVGRGGGAQMAQANQNGEKVHPM